MARDIPVGNGRLLVCLDQDDCLRDLHSPQFSQENQVGRALFRLGVCVDAQFSWVGPDWNGELRYLELSLLTEVTLCHKALGVLLVCKDITDFLDNRRSFLGRQVRDLFQEA